MRWEKVKLGNIAEFSNGVNFDKSAYAPGVKLISVSNFGNRFYPDYSELPEISADVVKENDYLQHGDIVFVRSNGNKELVGRCMLIDNPPTHTTYSGFCIRARVKDTKRFNPKFLTYHFKHDGFRIAIAGNAVGANIQNLSQGRLSAYIAHIPPIETQRRIADILSAYDDLIENNRKQIKLLEEAAQRLYKEWFVDLRFPGHEHTRIVDGVPEGWEKKQLSDIVEVKYGKDHKSIPDGNVPVYGSGGLMRKCNQMLYKGESVLIPRKGSLNNIIYVDEAFWTVDTMFYTKMKWPNIGVFIYYFIKSFDMYAMNIGAAVPSMTTNTLNSINVIIPSYEILKNFQSTTKVYFRKIELLKRQIEMAAQARDRLLPKLMSGEVEE